MLSPLEAEALILDLATKFYLGQNPPCTEGSQATGKLSLGRLALAAQGIEFALAGGSHSSGNLINLAQTNALAVVPTGQGEIKAGEEVSVMLIPQGLVL